ncbi:MAG: T9SS type A sorting domain-containing protein [Bacteroidota bacterium]|nr:T9SS type A sorting domain-containing protein [Bacteroidota bacterium]
MRKILLSIMLFVSILLQAQKPEVSVYPQPIKDVIYISLKNPDQSKIHITIQDVLGNIIAKQTYKSDELISISVADLNLSNGFYLLKLEQNDFHFVSKIIVKN